MTTIKETTMRNLPGRTTLRAIHWAEDAGERCGQALHRARDELASRWADVTRRPDAGYTTEAVVVTALLVAAALVVVAIIVAKVTEKANSITLGLG